MKSIITKNIIYGFVAMTSLIYSVAFAQTYDEKDFPEGTRSVYLLKQQYTENEIEQMFDKVVLVRKSDAPQKIGLQLQDTTTMKTILVSDTETVVLLFEIVKSLKEAVTLLNERLQSAGIP